MVTIYSTGCKRCKKLLKKIDQQGALEYTVCDDRDLMFLKGVKTVPAMELEDGTLLDYDAIIDLLRL